MKWFLVNINDDMREKLLILNIVLMITRPRSMIILLKRRCVDKDLPAISKICMVEQNCAKRS